MAENEKENEEQVLITEDEVWDVIEFARAMNLMYGNSYLSPELINSRMKDVNLNPMQADTTKLANAMSNPKDNEDMLRAFSQDFELQSMVYKRLISYLSNMLAFDITYVSDAKPEDYSKPRYKKDLESVEEFLDKFEYKKEFRVVIREMLRNDAYFGCFRNIGDKYILQELPPEYCKITGRWKNGYLFSFNMLWFYQTGVSLDMYPNFFKEKYNEMIMARNEKKEYIPYISPELRGKGSGWTYWVDIPVDLGVCFKLSPELATRLPYFTPLFNDLVLQGLIRNLQKNLNMAAANRLIIGEVPFLNKEIKATVRDSISISPTLLGKFMALVKSAISEAINVAAAPIQNIKEIDFETDNDMYDSYLRTALASSGINTNLIFSSNVKPNAIETQLSLNVDEQMMAALYEQFEDFVNYRLSKETSRFMFMVNFEGTDFSVDRDRRFEKAMSLMEQGIVMPQKIAASIGMKPSQMRKHMEEAKAMDFLGMLTPPSFEQQKKLLELQPNPYQQAPNSATKDSDKKQGSAGRPKKSLSELGEEGMKTLETGANVSKGGKLDSISGR